MNIILLIIVLILIGGVYPLYGLNPHLGYGFGGLGGILILLLILRLLGLI